MIQFWVFWDFVSSEVGKFARFGYLGFVVGYLGCSEQRKSSICSSEVCKRKRKVEDFEFSQVLRKLTGKRNRSKLLEWRSERP